MFWWNAEFLNFYEVIHSYYINVVDIKPFVARYTWNADFSKGGWCQMYYWTGMLAAINTEIYQNAKVWSTSVMDAVLGLNASSYNVSSGSYWAGMWAYNTDYQKWIWDSFLHFNPLVQYLGMTNKKPNTLALFNGMENVYWMQCK